MNKDPYRRIASWYDSLFEPVNAGLMGMGLKAFPVSQGMKVLDVGCGTGSQLMVYQQAGCTVYGLDTSPAMLEIARGKLGSKADLRLADAMAMPFEDDFFDLVLSTLVLHEMPPVARDGVLAEIKRVTKKEGRVLLIDFHPGPLRALKGWFSKTFITLSEIGAGREHFRNYRHFMAHQGLPGLIAKHSLTIEIQRIVSGGTIGLFLLSANC